jgi:hypothetical protein
MSFSFYLFVPNFVSTSHYIVSSDGMIVNNELEKIWKEVLGTKFKIVSQKDWVEKCKQQKAISATVGIYWYLFILPHYASLKIITLKGKKTGSLIQCTYVIWNVMCFARLLEVLKMPNHQYVNINNCKPKTIKYPYSPHIRFSLFSIIKQPLNKNTKIFS